MITLETRKVGELVAERPLRAQVFEKYGIDYCCGGKKTLADACAEKRASLEAVMTALEIIDNLSTETNEPDCANMTLSELCDHIETTHHNYLREELPRLTVLVEKVANAHGAKRPELVELNGLFGDFRAELESHMIKEEHVLFPVCRKLDAATEPVECSCGSVMNPIRAMEAEHDNAGDALGRMREITNGFTPPEGACNTYRAMLDSLARLEQDMHRHVHKENSILFPRTEARDRQLRHA